jgi:hypothetical protein
LLLESYTQAHNAALHLSIRCTYRTLSTLLALPPSLQPSFVSAMHDDTGR